MTDVYETADPQVDPPVDDPLAPELATADPVPPEPKDPA